jgi:hypothetical protein
MNQLTAHQLNQTLGTLKNDSLSVDSFLKMLDLMKELETISDDYIKAVQTLMKGYQVRSKGNNFFFGEHEKVEEIKEKLEAINSKEVEVVNLKFITKEEFAEATKGLSFNEIKELMVLCS